MNAITQLIRDRPAAAAVYIEGRTGRRVTGADLAEAVAHWRPRIARLGRAPVIAMATDDPLKFATTYLGLLAAGATVAPLDPAAPAAVTAQDIVDLGATARVVDGELAPVAGDGRDPVDGGGVLLRSSGSTGPRKLIHLSVPQLVHVAGAVARAHALTPEDVGYSPLPLFHVNAQVVGLLSTVVAESTLVVDQRFSRRRFWPTVAEHRVTWLNAVPAILAILEHDGDPHHGRPAGCAQVRFARSASAPLALPVLQRFEKTFEVAVVETYGMTEAASQICANPLQARRAGSVGVPVGLDLEVRDDEGATTAPGVVGQVHVRGRGVITGALPDGWLATGDLGRQDGDGYLYLTGRVSEVVNRGGEKVYPRRIEDALLRDPRVADAIVVGEPDEVLGEVPVAYLRVHPARDARSTAVAARARCRRWLSRAEQPTVIYVVEQLPVGATGKISRRQVRTLGPKLSAAAQACA